jgi:hypothetical protein
LAGFTRTATRVIAGNSSQALAKYAQTAAVVSGDLESRNPISGIADGCCARAASGQPAKLLPGNAMNSRRLMGVTQG